MATQYRPDIDGLRALAVVPVVAFHAGLPGFSGGYVGVDVFFVISGFLVTQIIWRELTSRSFSLARFYERRVRRIMPALMAVLSATAIVGALVLVPEELEDFAKSLVATLGFGSNFLFWAQAGYFDAPAEAKPLLHTWSLAVEEQFYFVLPLLLFAIARYARRFASAIVFGLLLLSFGLSVWGTTAEPIATFYLFPMRAWELLVGSLLGMGAVREIESRAVRNVLSLAGGFAIVWSVAAYSSSTEFPGAAALLPVLGAALVIHGNRRGDTVVSVLLGQRPLVFIGLISYSLYLWHWPIFVFARSLLERPFSVAESVALIAASFVLAAASWQLVEQPFRRGAGLLGRRDLFATATMASVVLAGVGVCAILAEGWPSRVPEDARRYARAIDDDNPTRETCHNTSVARVAAGDACGLGDSARDRIDFVVWGDSHADMWVPAFDRLAHESKVKGQVASLSSCPPLLFGDVDLANPHRAECARFNEAVLDQVETRDVRDVVLVARWNVSALGLPRFELANSEAPVFLRDESSRSISLEENRAVFDRGMRRTLARLTRDGRRVWIVMQVPYVGLRTPAHLARRAWLGELGPIVRRDLVEHAERSRALAPTLEALQRDFELHVIDPARALCEGSRCTIALDGDALYRDDDHLSSTGALRMAEVLRPIYEAIEASSASPAFVSNP